MNNQFGGFMAHSMKVIAIIFGVVSGAFVGLAFGGFTASVLGYLSQLTTPNDPSAGSISWVVSLLTVPCGAILGAFLGRLTITTRPRLFCATILPLTILIVAWQGTLSMLRGMDRPRNFVCEVLGTPGAKYVGLVSVDGDIVIKKGALPAKFEFEGFHIEFAFALVHPKEKNSILVNVSADGNDLGTGAESQTGVYQRLKSFGYSETYGGTSRTWSLMSQKEVEDLINNETMPQGMWEL
ncbi:hypothetical protein [Gimesia aquarii]|uniref:Uncharacterized protein n=1 Tax=Gimesia aquarii TaxID=2527964 RepID=A0A517W3Q0_9PLAN|nr:hypothetical protein [Gimesia aquarii]QDT99886.1 hypothetical protein V144x_54000 [Gimesia aquarii]